MATNKFFLQDQETRNYQLHNMEIQLDIAPEVFPPSSFVLPFAQNLTIYPGDRVADIGSGSGILSVLAAKLDAEVWATDTSSYAVLSTRQNARKNHVQVNAVQGSFFGSLEPAFDVIMANLPQEILPENYRNKLTDDLLSTISGGVDGNGILKEFLKIAPRYMHAKSRLYINVGTLSDYNVTLRLIAERYKARMMNSYALPCKPFVGNNIGFYKRLNDEGKVHIFQENGIWKAMIYPFELTLKDADTMNE